MEITKEYLDALENNIILQITLVSMEITDGYLDVLEKNYHPAEMLQITKIKDISLHLTP